MKVTPEEAEPKARLELETQLETTAQQEPGMELKTGTQQEPRMELEKMEPENRRNR